MPPPETDVIEKTIDYNPYGCKNSRQKFIDPMPDDKPMAKHPGAPLSMKDIVAPPSIVVDFDNLKIGNFYFRTLFVRIPTFCQRQLARAVISFNHTLDIAMYIYPTKSEEVQSLKRKVGEMESHHSIRHEARTRD